MNQEKYKLFLRNTKHTEKSIESRVARLKKVEEIFQIDVDSIIYNEAKVYEILDKLKTQNLDSSNQNLANALRVYYTCITGKTLKKRSKS